MKKLLLFFLLLLPALIPLRAAEATVEITAKNAATITGGPDGATVTYTQSYGTAKQHTKNNSGTLTIKGLAGYKITALSFETHSNGNGGAGSMTVKAGTTDLLTISGKYNTAWSNAYTTNYEWINPTMSKTDYAIQNGEDVTMKIAATANSLYWQAVKITYSPADSTDPTDPTEPDTPTEGITTISKTSFSGNDKNSASLDSYISYTTYQNNSTTPPAINSNCIRLYQQNSSPYNGGSIKIQASDGRKIRAIKITVNSGTTVAYKVDSGSYGEGITVSASSPLVISDIDATSVEIINRGTSSDYRFDIKAIEVTYYDPNSADPGKVTPRLDWSPATYSYTFGAENAALPTLSANPVTAPLLYKSSDATVATYVVGEGFKFLKAGTATITAEVAADDTYNFAKAELSITITKGTKTLAWNGANLVDGVVNFNKLTDNLADFVMPTLSGNDDLAVTITSSNTNVATISDGSIVLNADADGETTISAILIENGQYTSNTASFTLKALKLESGLAWSATTANCYVGEAPEFPTLSNPNSLTVSYASSDPTVATVSEAGVVTILKNGTTEISAIYAGNNAYKAATVKYTLTISKRDVSLAWSNLNDGAFTYNIGETTAAELPTLTIPEGITVTYSSSVPTVATISETGAINVLAEGTTVIKAEFVGNDYYNAASAQFTLTVVDPNNLTTVITMNKLSASSNNGYQYYSYTDKGVTYEGYVYKNVSNIQFNNSSSQTCGFYVTANTNGYILKSVTVVYANSTTKNFNAYGKSSAFPSKTTFSSTGATSVGTITASNTTLTLKNDYQYFGMVPASTGSFAVSSITFEWTRVVETGIANVEFNPATEATFIDKGIVRLSCETEGVTIRYTLDGSTPTAASTAYNSETGIEITESCTVNAAAFDGEGNSSRVTWAEYTVKKSSTLAEIKALAKNAAFIARNEYKVLAVASDRVYIYEPADEGEGTYGVIYKSSHGMKAGDVIAAKWSGTINKSEIDGGNALVPDNALTASETEIAVPAAKVYNAVADLTKSHLFELVKVSNVTLTAATPTNKTSFTGTVNGTNLALYNSLGVTTQYSAGVYNITGILIWYNSKAELLPLSYEAVSPCTAPRFVNESTEMTLGVDAVVRLACDDADATIRYRLDNGAATDYDTENGIVLPTEGSHTVVAWAEREGYTKSSSVEMTFNVTDPNRFGPITFNVANNQALLNGSKIVISCQNAFAVSANLDVIFDGKTNKIPVDLVEKGEGTWEYTVTYNSEYYEHGDNVSYLLHIDAMSEDEEVEVLESTLAYTLRMPGSYSVSPEPVEGTVNLLQGESLTITFEDADYVSYILDDGTTKEGEKNLTESDNKLTLTPKADGSIIFNYSLAGIASEYVELDIHVSEAMAYRWVKTATDLTPGDEYVIVANGFGYVMGEIKKTGNNYNTYTGAVEGSFSDDNSMVIVAKDADYVPVIIEAAPTSGKYLLHLSDGNYLASTITDKKPNVLLTATVDNPVESGPAIETQVSISFDNTGDATIKYGEYNSKDVKLLFNGDRFNTYTSSQTHIQIYKLVGTSAPTFTYANVEDMTNMIFDNIATVTINTNEGCTVYSTTDGSVPTTASSTATSYDLNATTTINAIAVDGEGVASRMVSTTVYHRPATPTFNFNGTVEDLERMEFHEGFTATIIYDNENCSINSTIESFGHEYNYNYTDDSDELYLADNVTITSIATDLDGISSYPATVKLTMFNASALKESHVKFMPMGSDETLTTRKPNTWNDGNGFHGYLLCGEIVDAEIEGNIHVHALSSTPGSTNISAVKANHRADGNIYLSKSEAHNHLEFYVAAEGSGFYFWTVVDNKVCVLSTTLATSDLYVETIDEAVANGHEYRFTIKNGAKNAAGRNRIIAAAGNPMEIVFGDTDVLCFNTDDEGHFFTTTGSMTEKQSPIVIYRSEDASTTGVEDVNVEGDVNADDVYYNLQGIRIETPANGYYIRRNGNAVEKVLVR